MNYSDGHDWIQVGCYGCGTVRSVPIYCGNRFCELCTKSRRAKTEKRIDWMVSHLKQRTDEKFRMLTLSIKSEQDLREMVRHITTSFRKLRQTTFWKKKVSGGAYVIEITRGNLPGYWHAHIHAIISNRFFRVETLFEAWHKASNSYNCHIDLIGKDAIKRYLTKYITKSKLSADDAYLAAMALKGCRLFTPFGSWHKSAIGCPKIKLCCPECGSTEMTQLEFMNDRERNYELVYLESIQASRVSLALPPAHARQSGIPCETYELHGCQTPSAWTPVARL